MIKFIKELFAGSNTMGTSKDAGYWMGRSDSFMDIRR